MSPRGIFLQQEAKTNMFGKKKRAPQPRGQGGAAAKQMGLFVDPEEMMMGMDGNLDDTDLEAELAAITGKKAAAGGKTRQKGKSPLPMEDIARMADECMRDLDDDDDDSVEDDEDLLAELQEVVGEDEAEDVSSPSSATAESPQAETPESPAAQEEVKVSSAAPGSLQHTLEERLAMYKTALQNAKTAGEASKARRYDRGLKTLESLLAAVKKGRSVNEAEIPPPVSTGAPSAAPRPAVPARPAPPVPSRSQPTQPEESEPTAPPPAVPDVITPSSEEEQSSSATLPTLSSLPSPEEKTDEEAADLSQSRQSANDSTKKMLLDRQKEYKMAALRAKKQGDVEQAKLYFKTSKSFDAVIEALEKGQSVDLSNLPPPPEQGSGGSSAPVAALPAGQSAQPTQPAASAPAPSAPKDVLQALEQRRAKYAEASAQAKASGDDRKARMHDRIAKQYQSAIREIGRAHV